MNKKTIKIAGWALGLSMAVAGIGAAVVSNQGSSMEVFASDGTMVYTPSTKNTGSFGTGANAAAKGVTATFANTYNNANQMTGGNSMTLTLSTTAEHSYKIDGITLSLKTNKSSGTGSASAAIGETEIGTYSIPTIGTSYDTKSLSMKTAVYDTAIFDASHDLVITVSAAANSVYCQTFSITYTEVAQSQQEVTSVEITHGMNTTTYTSSDESWSKAGLAADVTVDGGGDYTGAVSYSFDPETPTDALNDANWNGKVSIVATAGGVDSDPFLQDVTVTWTKGSLGNPYTVSEANAAYSASKTYYITGYIAYISGKNYWITDDFLTAKAGTLDTSTSEGKAASWELFNVSSGSPALGDKVVVHGTTAKYSGQNEFSSGTTVFDSITSNALSAFRATAVTKTHYENEEISLSDFTFEADYGSETGVEITSGVTITSQATKYSAGVNSITFSYTERNVTKTSTIEVSAEEDTRVVTALQISGSMTGMSYYDDEEWDDSVLSFALVYDDESTLEVDSDSAFLDYEFQDGEGNPVSSPAAGMTEVNVYAIYDDGDISFDQTITLSGFSVTAVEVTSLNWENQDVAYKVGDHFSLKGTITAIYNKAEHNKEIALGDDGVTVTLGGDHVTVEYGVKLTDDGKTLVVAYGGKSVQANIAVYKDVFLPGDTDEITLTTTGWTSGSYTDWSGKTSNSDAIYSGNSMGNNAGAIQMRDSKNSGIVTTATGGVAKKITVEWNSSTASARKLYVYGKNTAYESSADIYSSDADVKGTKIGEIDNSKNETELDLGSEYAYIALQANGGAIYLDSIAVEWVERSATSDIIAVESFIDQYMHLDAPVDSEGKTGNMSCLNWYEDAKDHFAGNDGKEISGLTEAQKNIILKSDSVYSGDWKYTDVRDRLAAWAKENNDTFDVKTGAFSAAGAAGVWPTQNVDQETLPLIVTAVSAGLLAAGGFVLLRRKKEDR